MRGESVSIGTGLSMLVWGAEIDDNKSSNCSYQNQVFIYCYIILVRVSFERVILCTHPHVREYTEAHQGALVNFRFFDERVQG